MNTTAELVIGEPPEVQFRRLPDPATGYDEFDVRPSPSGEDGGGEMANAWRRRPWSDRRHE